MKLKYLVPFILGSSLLAQTGTPTKSPIQPSSPAVAALSELEQTKLELYSTQNLLLRKQEDDLRAKYNQLVIDINAAHPGYQFNQQTGQLQPVPKAPEVKK
jgi:hypothetical protein